jgi:hypothetical protein
MLAPVKILLLLFTCLLPFRLLAQTNQAENKIALPFRILLARQKEINRSRISDTLEKKYHCIIYTTNPAALRKKGIAIQSELPRFVTALATLKQIVMAAAMSEVSYIEAPDYLKPYND